MKKTFLIFLLLAVLISSASCGKIVDPNAAKGSVIETTENEETEPHPEPTPEPTPQPNSDYGDYSYGGGDSGGGIVSFSSGGSSYSGSGSSSDMDSLPKAQSIGAELISNLPSRMRDTREIDIFEDVSETADGSLTDAARDKINDENLKGKLENIRNILKTDRKFSNFFFLVVSQKNKPDRDNVKIKLNDTYRNKVAYIFFIDNKGNIKKINKNSDKDYISYKLDGNNFMDDTLVLDFGMNPGSFVISFGK